MPQQPGLGRQRQPLLPLVQVRQATPRTAGQADHGARSILAYHIIVSSNPKRPAQAAATAGASLVLDIGQDLDPRQVCRQGTQVASPNSGRRRGAVPRSHLLLRRFSRSDGLLEVLQAELQLVGVELLRAAAEPAALQLPDQELQLLDRDLSRVTLGTDGIPLGQSSSVLDLEGSDPGVLCGDDFHRLLQLLQQQLMTSWRII